MARPSLSLTYLVLAVVLAAVFIPMSIARIADSDEGAYLIAAKLVMQGKLLYHDFSYPQMPLLPYLYGAWMKLFGVSWYSARLLSAAFAVALGLALFRQVLHLTRDRRIAVLATVAFASSGLAAVWYPAVKTFVFPTLMLFLAWAVLDSGWQRWKYFLSGLFLGLAVATRIYALVAVFVLAIEVVRREPGRNGARQLGWFAAGLGVAFLPMLPLFLIDPDTFVFNVIGHHVIRSGGLGAVGDFSQKVSTVLLLLTLVGSEGATSLQFTILLFLNAALGVSRLIMRERLPPSAPIAALLLLVSVMLTPTYPQYACIPLPFMIVNAALLAADIVKALPSGIAGTGARRKLGHVAAVLLALYVLVVPVDLSLFIVGRDVPPMIRVDDWKIPTINRVARAIDEAVPAGNPVVITWWPGYLIESKASILPHTENHLNLYYSFEMSPSDVGRYNYISIFELIDHIRRHKANVVVLGLFVFDGRPGSQVYDGKPLYRRLLAESGYTLVRRIGDTEIYRWPGA